MMTITRLVAVCAFLVSHSCTGSFNQAFHANLTQIASVGCTVADTLTMTFFLDAGTDAIGAIYLVNQTDPFQNTEATFSLTTGNITGIGAPNDQYTFSVVATLDLNTNQIIDVTPGSRDTLAEIQGSDVLSVIVMVKSNHSFTAAGFMPNVIFSDDVSYVATCNISNVQDVLVSTGQIRTTGIVDEVPNQIVETFTLQVVDPGNQQKLAATVGEPLLLKLELTGSAQSNLLGFYAHSCSVCDASDCTGAIAFEIIDYNGCPVSDYFSSFKANFPSQQTDPFLAFVFRGSGVQYFRCTVGLCYTQGDPKCVDFCQFNKAKTGRKRRDVTEEQSEEIAVSTFLRVTVGENDEIIIDQMDPVNQPDMSSEEAAAAEKQQDQQNTVLLGTVVALAALLLVGLAAAILIFYHLSSKTKAHC